MWRPENLPMISIRLTDSNLFVSVCFYSHERVKSCDFCEIVIYCFEDWIRHLASMFSWLAEILKKLSYVWRSFFSRVQDRRELALRSVTRWPGTLLTGLAKAVSWLWMELEKPKWRTLHHDPGMFRFVNSARKLCKFCFLQSSDVCGAFTNPPRQSVYERGIVSVLPQDRPERSRAL